ncbi:hypothetical protein NLU13_6466 [Sarocladium strictum]|uniref:Kinetochore protein fta4 n=1 Tax=Sarocladium strictum TaxID=5046 RepID=A0AA39GG99_SARSR|nr:hypothetical protein NLU13_6466 [Sarocladium strictum]
MARNPPTIPAAKQAFLNTQTNLLSQPLAPSRAWRNANDASSDAIPARHVDEALVHVNHAVQQHCRRVFAPQATRAIAEQIADAYTRDADRRIGRDGDDEDVIGKEADLTTSSAIESLPAEWYLAKDTSAYPLEAKRYTDTVQHLTDLNEQRNQLRLRVEKLRRIQTSLAPLQTGEGGEGVQENLVTRNGAVEKELEKMRFLLARVAGRVGQLPDAIPGGETEEEKAVEDLGKARKRQIDEFLADPAVFPS